MKRMPTCSFVETAFALKRLQPPHFQVTFRRILISGKRLTLLILIPMVFARRVFCDSAVEEIYRNSLGRIAFFAEMIVVYLFFIVSFRPSGAATSPLLELSRGGWLYRMRHLWYGALVLLPPVFAVLYLLGYDYTAGQLYQKFIATVLLVFAVMFCKNMATRWLALVQAQWVLRQKAKKMAEKGARAVQADSKLDNSESSQAQPVSEEDHEQTAVNVSRQTLRLVQWVAVLAVFLGIWLIWKNVLPALSAFENIRVWDTTDAQGDTVTVGDIDGIVTQIKMRATTIRKGDRKELIVPNREFITGRLLNWSLSDKTLRLEFPIGVAYGSDIKRTEETLYRVARNQEGVIQDAPAPLVIFRPFGESSLDFELRVYIPHMDNYLKIWHEINCAIDTESRTVQASCG